MLERRTVTALVLQDAYARVGVLNTRLKSTKGHGVVRRPQGGQRPTQHTLKPGHEGVEALARAPHYVQELVEPTIPCPHVQKKGT